MTPGRSLLMLLIDYELKEISHATMANTSLHRKYEVNGIFQAGWRELSIQSNAIWVEKCVTHIPEISVTRGIEMSDQQNLHFYIDDIVIYSRNWKQRLEQLKQVFERCRYMVSRARSGNVNLGKRISNTWITLWVKARTDHFQSTLAQSLRLLRLETKKN